MTDEKLEDIIQAHEAEGSWRDGWPAMIMSVIIISAALYSFSPRPKPDFPATAVNERSVLVASVARSDGALIGVGEQGQILRAQAADGPWQAVRVEPQRGTTLTAVAVVAPDTLVAVGHDSWILRSSDAGASWREVNFNAERSEPLLGLAGPYDGRLYAYGAFGQFLVSEDLGLSWQRRELVKNDSDEADAGGSDPFADPFASEDDGDYDPFGGGGDDDPFADPFGGGSFGMDDFSTRHLNGLIQARDGNLWLVGERGLVARSSDGAQTWDQFETGYNGSFYGVLQLGDDGILVHGMRGHVFVSSDQGQSWREARTGVRDSLFTGVVLDSGAVLLAGGSHAVIRSKDNGRSFTRVSDKGAKSVADILPLAADRWLLAGEAGIQIQTPVAAAKGEQQ